MIPITAYPVPIPVPVAASPEQLCAEWMAAKQREKIAGADRVAIEERLTAIFDAKLPEEGSKTIAIPGFKATFERGFSRKLDLETGREVIESIPANLRPVRTKEEVVERGIVFLQEHHPKLYDLLKPYLTTTPKKVGVKIVAVEPEE